MSPPEVAAEIRGLPDHLRVSERIGAGSHKTVYRAFDHSRDEEIAISCIPRMREPSIELARRRELQALGQIEPHPNVLALLDVIETDEHLILCVPYLSGGDLFERIESMRPKPLPLHEALRIGIEIADALAHVHAHGIIHGDVKPENVLVDSDGSVRLADFGLAQQIHESASPAFDGTLTHLAPERIRGDATDARSDLYSLGCLLYQLLSGRDPHAAANHAEVLNLHLIATPRPIRDGDPAIPMDLSRLVSQLLEKQPDARPRGASEVLAALVSVQRTLAYCQAGGTALPSRQSIDERLENGIQNAARGVPGFVILTGELGAGKSESLARLMSRAIENGCGAAVGVAEDPSDLPFGPLVSALAGLAVHSNALTQADARTLRAFLYLDDPEAGRPPDDPRTRGERLFAAIFAALKAASQSRPMLLVVEDLHEADDASLELLGYLEFAIRNRDETLPLPLFIVASCRGESIPDRLADLLAQCESQTGPTHLQLGALTARDFIRLCEAHGLTEAERPLVDRIELVSRGNALNAVEVLRYLRATNASEHPAQAAGANTGTSQVSGSLDTRRLVEDQLDRRSVDARATLELGAVLGLEFDPGWASRLAQRLGFDFRTGLEEVLDSGILVERAPRLAFNHPLVRELLSRRVDPERRATIHMACVEDLLASSSKGNARRELEVAQHLIAAEGRADPEDIVRFATLAGGHALSRFAWTEATRFFDAALRNLPPEGSDSKRADLLHQMGVGFFRLLAPKPCLANFDRAIELYAKLGDDAKRARAVVDRARAVNSMGLADPRDYQHARDEFSRCLEALPDADRSLRAEILAGWAATCWAQADPEEAERLALEALAQSHPERDHALRAEINLTLGMSQFSQLDHRHALASLRSGAQEGRLGDDLISTARCLQRAQLALFASGQVEESRAISREVVPMNRVFRLPSESMLNNAILASTAVFEGDFTQAEVELTQALEHLERAQYPWGRILIAPTIACARALSGDPNGAWSTLEALADSQTTAPALQQVLEASADRHRALVDFFVGEPVRLPHHVRKDLIARVASAKLDETGLYQAAVALELAHVQQDAALAHGALPNVENALERGSVLTTAWPFFLPRLVGAALLVAGEVGRAIAALRRALASRSLDRFPIEAGRTRLDLARALVLYPRRVETRRSDSSGLGVGRHSRTLSAQRIPGTVSNTPGTFTNEALKPGATPRQGQRKDQSSIGGRNASSTHHDLDRKRVATGE